MPIYDFRCECGNEELDWPCRAEEIEKQECPECEKLMVATLFYSNRMQKGSTWYNDGDIDRFEIVHTDKAGKETVIDMRNKMGDVSNLKVNGK